MQERRDFSTAAVVAVVVVGRECRVCASPLTSTPSPASGSRCRWNGEFGDRHITEDRSRAAREESDPVISGRRKDAVRLHATPVVHEQLDARPIDQEADPHAPG
jgi:hypothetical protein